MAKTIQQKMVEADERCNRYLADANAAEEQGCKAKAAELFEKSGYWRDRYNNLAGNA